MSVSEPLVKTVASNILWLKTQDKLSFSEVFEQPETLQVFSRILTEIINPILSSPISELSSKFAEKQRLQEKDLLAV